MLIETTALPTLAVLSTAHWPVDQQRHFTKAVDGILSADWFQALAGDQMEKEPLATAFAFAAFSNLRRRLYLAPDEELMLDNPGRRRPSAVAR